MPPMTSPYHNKDFSNVGTRSWDLEQKMEGNFNFCYFMGGQGAVLYVEAA